MTMTMILTALLPEGAGGSAGCAETPTAEPAAAGAPHAVQICLSGDNAAPHFVQKLAMTISLLFSPDL